MELNLGWIIISTALNNGIRDRLINHIKIILFSNQEGLLSENCIYLSMFLNWNLFGEFELNPWDVAGEGVINFSAPMKSWKIELLRV